MTTADTISLTDGQLILINAIHPYFFEESLQQKKLMHHRYIPLASNEPLAI